MHRARSSREKGARGRICRSSPRKAAGYRHWLSAVYEVPLMIWFEFIYTAFVLAVGFMLLFVGRFYAMRAQGCLGVGFLLSMAYMGVVVIFLGVGGTAFEIWGDFWVSLVDLAAFLVAAGCGWLLWSMRAARERLAALGGPLGKGMGFVLLWVAVLAVCYSLWVAAELALVMLGY